MAVVGSLALGAAGFALADTQTVSLNSDGPDPATITVAWGDTLEFQNDDSVGHGLTSPYPELKADLIPAGQTYTTSFTNRTITYGYRQTGKKRYPGVVVVRFSGHVSLGARPAAVARGQAVTLKGVSSRDNTPVLLELRAGGSTLWTRLKVVASGSSGGFAATVRLQRGGKVRATIEAGRIQSPAVAVGVKPTISISRRGGRIHARVTPADAASQLTLQCRAKGGWRELSSRATSANGTVTFPARRGTLRVSALRRFLAPGFAPQSSRAFGGGGC
ncbi:MAG: cupredoxin domain-containing protein [Gaiellaceae bacterium]